MIIIPFEKKYRDVLIFMILEAKKALGVIPRLYEDLLDIDKNYLEKGDMFWLMIEEGRVIGSIGYNTLDKTDEVRLHRFYVKYNRKRQGIGSKLLETAESYLRMAEKTSVLVHLGGDAYVESRRFYPKHGYVEFEPGYMRKYL